MSERVVVVGAGIVGLWTAYELQRRGMDVVVIDKGELGSGSSIGNAGWVIPARTLPMPSPGLHWEGLRMMVKPDSPLYIRPTALPGLTGWFTQFLKYCNAEAYQKGSEAMTSMSVHAHAGYDRLVEDGLEFEMHADGLLSVFLNGDALENSLKDYEAMGRLGTGQPVKMTAAEAREFEPELGPDVIGGILIKKARHIDPGTLLDALAGRLRERGAQLHFSTEVTGLVREGERITGVRTKNETVSGDHVVVATGAWAGALLRPLGYSVPLEAGKGYSLSYKVANPKLRTALFLEETKIACTPMGGGTRFAGTIEFSGINLNMDRRRLESIHRGIPQFLPKYDAGDVALQWVGMRPVTPDGLPVIGRIPGFENAFIASGHSTAGLALAPPTAERIAALIGGAAPPQADPFAPGRFN